MSASPKLIRVMQEGDEDGGNQLFLYDYPEGARVLKVYRRRGGVLGEGIRSLSHRIFERKRGVSASSRRETERRGLACWREAGFDVPQFYDDPPPDPTMRHALWLEYCPGPSIADEFENPDVSLDRRRELLTRVARRMGRRHLLAFEQNEPLLIPEHASIKHVIIYGDRLVQIDLENGYRHSFSIIEAACQELSGTLRSVARKAEPDFDALVDSFIPAYGHSEQLARIAAHGASDAGFYRGVKRWQDGRRRQRFSKTTMFEQVLDRLRADPATAGAVARAIQPSA